MHIRMRIHAAHLSTQPPAHYARLPPICHLQTPNPAECQPGLALVRGACQPKCEPPLVRGANLDCGDWMARCPLRPPRTQRARCWQQALRPGAPRPRVGTPGCEVASRHAVLFVPRLECNPGLCRPPDPRAWSIPSALLPPTPVLAGALLSGRVQAGCLARGAANSVASSKLFNSASALSRAAVNLSACEATAPVAA